MPPVSDRSGSVEVGGGMGEPWLLPLSLTAWQSALD